MHSQLLTPDTTTPFTGKQDVLARLLPYHVYAQCEPPPAAVEKGESTTLYYNTHIMWSRLCVAQVLHLVLLTKFTPYEKASNYFKLFRL